MEKIEKLTKLVMNELEEMVKNGGEGSGDFDHAGRPGEVGGSEPAGTGRKGKYDKKENKQETKKETTIIETQKKENLTDKNSPFGEGVEIKEFDKKGMFVNSKNLKSYKKGDKFAIVDDFSDKDRPRYHITFGGNGNKQTKVYGTEKGMQKAIREHLNSGANKETKALETKTDLNTAETNYKEVLKKYNEAGKKRWEQNISQDEYHKAWEDYEKYKKELTTARREYAESIMSNFEKSEDTSFEDKQNARRERYENLSDKAKQQSNQKRQSFRDKMSVIPMGQPIHGQKDARYREKAWDTLGQAVKLSDKANYYEDKAKSVGKAGISADDKNAILKLAEKYKSGVDSAEKRRIIDRVISIHENNKMAQTSKVSESYEKLGFNVERNSDANRLQLKFDGIPDASTRSVLKSNGFRWSPSNKAWQRQLGSNAEYSLKRVVETLSAKVENCIYKHEYLEY